MKDAGCLSQSLAHQSESWWERQRLDLGNCTHEPGGGSSLSESARVLPTQGNTEIIPHKTSPREYQTIPSLRATVNHQSLAYEGKTFLHKLPQRHSNLVRAHHQEKESKLMSRHKPPGKRILWICSFPSQCFSFLFSFSQPF